eukprot:maker-scaffold144_size312663-snap-gene-0.8 protein:Tk07264 transcript:maker-scaffold144_size312663-snap-gene-0.8-mRNA-1 annotation:"hypothetical protein PHAVU_007G238700g"
MKRYLLDGDTEDACSDAETIIVDCIKYSAEEVEGNFKASILPKASSCYNQNMSSTSGLFGNPELMVQTQMKARLELYKAWVTHLGLEESVIDQQNKLLTAFKDNPYQEKDTTVLELEERLLRLRTTNIAADRTLYGQKIQSMQSQTVTMQHSLQLLQREKKVATINITVLSSGWALEQNTHIECKRVLELMHQDHWQSQEPQSRYRSPWGQSKTGLGLEGFRLRQSS